MHQKGRIKKEQFQRSNRKLLETEAIDTLKEYT